MKKGAADKLIQLALTHYIEYKGKKCSLSQGGIDLLNRSIKEFGLVVITKI